MRTDEAIYSSFDSMWEDVKPSETFPGQKPLLAHYTSISTLEGIVSKNELWFSNPLFMNDVEELRFGILEGARAFRESKVIRDALSDATQYAQLAMSFDNFYVEFDTKHAFDTYVFCLSEHEANDTDGRLSMWRGYGSNGNGVAVVFDTKGLAEIDDSPFILSKVNYGTASERSQWIRRKLDEFAAILQRERLPADKLWLAAHALFSRLKLFALFTKHCGFKEEQEWRVAYLPERDTDGKISQMVGYSIGNHGVEPKLKMRIDPIKGITSDDFSLEKLVERIILGPSISSPLAAHSVHRMLKSHAQHRLAERLVASTTPFRPR